MAQDTPKATSTAYRLVAESGTHFGTVETRAQAASNREFYADRFNCIVLIQPVYGPKPQRW